jgi:hypothetical protein
MLVEQLGLHPRLVQMPMEEILPEQLLHWSDYSLPADLAHAIGPACRAYFETFARRATGRADGMLLHKATMAMHHFDRLLRHWPDARIVYLVRHPLGVVASMINADLHRFHGRFGYEATVANSTLRWANDILAYLRSSAAGSDRVLRIKYEDLVRDPDATLAAIHRFAGIEPRPYEPLVARERYDHPFVLSAAERAWIAGSTRDLVTQLGYDRTATLETPDAGSVDTYATRRLGARPPTLDGVELVHAAVGRAVTAGADRIGLFGAGYLAHLVAPHLDDASRRAVCCLIDEDPLLRGRTLAGLPIVDPDGALEVGVETVIPLTLVHQHRLARRWARVGEPAVPVELLWEEPDHPVAAAAATGSSADMEHVRA